LHNKFVLIFDIFVIFSNPVCYDEKNEQVPRGYMAESTLPHLVSIEDDAGVRESLEIALNHLYQIHFFTKAENALEYLSKGEKAHIILLDRLLPGMDGMEALPKIKALCPEIPVIMLSAVSDAPSGVKAIKLGAYDYLVKPFLVDELRNLLKHAMESTLLQRENAVLRKEISNRFHPNQLIGLSPAMEHIRNQIFQTSEVFSNVLITGETGTGKELVAKAIHHAGFCRSGPFIAVNCAALPKELVESELFGHEKGAFTGAHETRIGAFEQAQNGTLFLDEIAELELPIQAKLLRVLEERQLRRLGGNKILPLHVRLISATNKNLTEALHKNEFRKDLYYRICVYQIPIPPLRERREDIFPLIEYWAKIFRIEMGIHQNPQFKQKLIEELKKYDWPGNVRELKNMIESLMLSNRHLKPLVFDLKHLHALSQTHLSCELTAHNGKDPGKKLSLEESVNTFERNLIEEQLSCHQGNLSAAALALKTTLRILRYRVKTLGIKNHRGKKPSP
jgi:DNA-binding NtrC family response regulator